MIRATLADAFRPRFGIPQPAWTRIVQLAVRYQQGGFDWPDGHEPPPPAPVRWRFYRSQRARLIEEEWR